MQKFDILEQNGIRVLTSMQLAEAYGTNSKVISHNFTRNKNRYIEGKHFICITGEKLRKFKTNRQIGDSMKRVNILYLWTEKGALLHAKSLNTDRAWEVYDYLVDFYFRAKETAEMKGQRVSLPVTATQQQLAVGDECVLAYNRGIVLGVLRHELEEDSTLEIYERLSARGKGMVMKLIFGEVRHD